MENIPFMEIRRCYDCGTVTDKFFTCNFHGNRYWEVVTRGYQVQPNSNKNVVMETEMRLIKPEKIFCVECVKEHDKEEYNI